MGVVATASREHQVRGDRAGRRVLTLIWRAIQVEPNSGETLEHGEADAGRSTDPRFADEERYYFALVGSDLGLWDWDIRTNHTYFSDQYTMMLGYEANEWRTEILDWADHIHADDLPLVVAAVDNHLEGLTEQYKVEMRMLTRSGEYMWIDSRGRIIERDELGFPARMIGTHADIDQRKQSEVQLHEQAMLVDKAHDAIFVLDLDNRIMLWNRSAEVLYRVEARAALENSIFEVLQVDNDALTTAIATTRRNGEWAGELTIDVGADKPVIGDCRLTLVNDERGDPRSILAITTDISERKEIEAHFLRAQRMESIGTLAGGVAHDLNNVLAPILLYCDMLALTHRGDPVTQERIWGIETSARRASGLVAQLLNLARGTQGSRLPIRMQQLIAETSRLASETFARSIEISAEMSGDLWQVEGDPTQLHQVLVNLCVNARDAMTDGGTLSVTARNETLALDSRRRPQGVEGANFCVIEVSDTGHGMAPDVLAQIFDPFYTTKETGTGIGLSTVQSIVRSHGGFVDVESTPGVGSRFMVYLPAHDGARPELDDPKSIKQFDGRGQTVLVVDDEELMRAVLAQVLDDHGYNVLLAEDGAEALDVIAVHGPDIDSVLIDMQMPRMTGHELIRRVRETTTHTLVVASSGVNSPEVEAAALESGANLFLAKPYKTVDLLNALVRTISVT